jgi:hypothetical protein
VDRVEIVGRGRPVETAQQPGPGLNGSAEALAEADKSYWPPGIDYSRSVLASPRFSRLFGAMVLAIGAIFVGQAVIQL